MPAISTASLEYIRVPVAATISGLVLNPTSDTVKFAFLTTTRDPIVSDWVIGSWETAGSTYYALCLVGPGGSTTLVAGTYYVWVQITDNPEIPVKQAGVIQVV